MPVTTAGPIHYIDCSPGMQAQLQSFRGTENLVIHQGDPTPEVLRELLNGAVVVLNGHTHMSEAQLREAPHLKSVVFLGTGATSYIDVAAAERLGIRVRVVRGYGDRTVAEHAFGLLLAAARDTARMDRGIRAGRWSASLGVELAGRTLGLVGLGGVGSEMARIASSFGMTVIAWNRSGVPQGVPATPVDLDGLLTQSDAVSLHLALTPETRGLLDARRLAQLKPGCLLVNTARGAIIDEDALVACLESGRIAHAALDVFDAEPLPVGHPLTRLDNVTLTAHAAWKSGDASRRLMQMSLDLAQADARALAAGQLLAP